jgi:diguanylate cyclase (GGDEF)-like protein
MYAEILLDARTLLLAAAVAMPVFSWELFAMRRSVVDSTSKGLSVFALAHILLTVGVVLVGLRGSIPYALSMVGGNASVMTACVLYLMAARRFDGVSAPAVWGWLAAVVATLLMASMLAVDDNRVRVVVSTSWMALACTFTSISLFRNTTRINHHRWLTIVSFAGLALANTLRAVEAATDHEAASGLFNSSSGVIGLYLCVLVLGLASSTGFILMVTDHIQARLSFLATHDVLTQARSRGSFMDLAAHELRRAERTQSEVAFMMIDVDHFKQRNDTMGHQAGDAALQVFSECVRSSLRANDTLGRYGGDEFVVILPDTNEADALRVADRIRLALHTHPMQTRFRARPLTASIGIASSRHHGLGLETLIAAADTAVYESKRLGRDRASVARSALPRS